ncbi:MAG: hypothetical protein PHE25_01180 [Candidatus Gracilibacteria bacterium]|nr:hypothetical protein [Candidatus Gracilibacteria bacterium]
MFIETVFAMQAGDTNGTSALFSSKMDIGDFLLFAISMIVLFAGIFSILYILWGGVLLILSGGKDDKIKPAINSIRYALIGLGVIVLSIFVFPKIAGLLGLDVTKYSSPDKIFKEIKILGDKIFGTKSTTTIDSNGDIKNVNSLPNDFSDL